MRDELDFSDGVVAEAVVRDSARYDHVQVAIDGTRQRAPWKQTLIKKLYDEFGSGALVMQLAEWDLNSRLQQTRLAGISPMECAAIISPIAAALAKLHEHGVVHADVKQRNVVFVDKTWKLIDLDAAQRIGGEIDTSREDFKWTSGFASPELARCRTAAQRGTLIAQPAMDVFSLGIVIFELLTGQPLFSQDTCNNSMTDQGCVVRSLQILSLYLSLSLALAVTVLATRKDLNERDLGGTH